jgi:alpha-beta hydrolase superfamily lysophospholipase
VKFLVLLITVVQLVFIPVSFAKTEIIKAGKPNLEREKRMAAEVEDAVLDGEVIYLKDGEHSFMAIDQEPEGDTKGAVIILHGRGFHPNWEDTVFPLRTQLPNKGWRTLSLQMPVLIKSAKYYDYVPLFSQAGPRIEAGIKHLKDQGIKNIILLAHSCGGHMAMEWIRSKDGKMDDNITAYIGAGMGATDFGQKMAKPFPYDKLTIPVLDVFGSKEYPAVLVKAPGRLMSITKAGNSKSKQIIIPGANHYFTDKGDELVEPVVKWLDSL